MDLARNWTKSLRCSRRAVELDPSDQGAWWNLGIAATALRQWRQAREAWHFGIDLPSVDEKWAGLGHTACVRLNPETKAEVVWAERLDPARMKLISAPLPASGRRFRDIVLNDGESTGRREIDGQVFPCSMNSNFGRPRSLGLSAWKSREKPRA